MTTEGLPDNAGLAVPMSGRFGNYEVLDTLGDDGVAEVLKCRGAAPEAGERLVVIRRMRLGLSEPRSLARLFLAEARLAQRLSHPNIARIHEVDELEQAPYTVAEYVEGPTLAQVICQAWRQQRPCGRVVARVLAEIAGALAHAHLACDPRGRPLGIVHRDVTPRNIVLASDDSPKLLDFGVVRLPGRPAPEGPCAKGGRLWHLAPEQLRGAFVDGRSDVFSVGVCLYLAATGQSPYPSRDEVAVQQAVARGAHLRPSRANPSIEPELEALIEWAMDPSVERRPSALALRQALDAYASQGPEPVTLAMVGSFVRELLGPASEGRQFASDHEVRPSLFPSREEERIGDAVRPVEASSLEPLAPPAESTPKHDPSPLGEVASASPRPSAARKGWSAVLRAWRATRSS